jgi:hypothetical protein
MSTIPVGPDTIKHWKPAAYANLVKTYDDFNCDPSQSFEDYCDIFAFNIANNGRLYMSDQDEGLVWVWDSLSDTDSQEGCWREFDVSKWHWGEGRPL